MEIEQYRELNDLKTYLVVKSKQKIAEKIKLRESHKDLAVMKQDLMEALKTERYHMEIDKELRDLHEITNQTAWKRKIKELTQDKENEMNKQIEEMEEEINKRQDTVALLSVRIEEARWELTIKHEYYLTNPGLVKDVGVLDDLD